MLQKDLAHLLGISPAMVSKLAKRGMPVDSLERAQRWRRRHLELARGKDARPPAARAPEGPGGSPDDEPADDEQTSAEYRTARADREKTRAERERIELQRLRRELIEVEVACRLGFSAMRSLRDRLQLIGMRVAPTLLQVIAGGATLDALQAPIDDEINQALSDAASIVEQMHLEDAEDEDDDG